MIILAEVSAATVNTECELGRKNPSRLIDDTEEWGRGLFAATCSPTRLFLGLARDREWKIIYSAAASERRPESLQWIL